MKNLSDKQKIALMRILLDIVLADNVSDERELTFFNKIADEISLAKDYEKEVKSTNTLVALLEIDKLNEEYKNEFAELMGEMIIADENIHYKEVEIYDSVCYFCHIDTSNNPTLWNLY